MEVGPALRITSLDLLRVSLDEPTASLLDGGESGAEPSPCDPVTTVAATGEDAADPPVRKCAELPGVGFRVLDVRKLHRRPVLAPADTVISVINEDLVDGAVADVGLLGVAIPSRGVALADALGVETHAPAPAPDPVVGLHQPGEVVPGGGRK